MRYILFFIVLFAITGCNPKKENVAVDAEATEYIVVKDVFNNISSEFLLSEIASDIEIIPLKFDAANVFDRIDKIRVDGDDLFISSGLSKVFSYNRKAVKSYEDCLYPRVADMFETPENIYISLEKDKSCYLIRYGKKERNVEAIESKGDIRSGGINNTHFRAVYPPALKNDLCGGLPFYPDFCDDERLIKVYSPEDLLEQIDIETLKNEQVLMPEKKKELLNLLHSLKSDDNPVVVIATLK